ncbi:MAG: DMT family transporter [Deltaproteobacteria bacterium]|jgi:drug/metabolite transporter (DMT)-like permease|nr:DMT family transporter [Deltaproteobacteria bacterium]
MTINYQEDKAVLGILFLLAGVVVFSIQDVIIRSLSGGYPVFEIMFCRAITAFIPCLILVYFDSGFASLKSKKIGLHILRSLLMLLAYTFFYLGIAAMPLADVIALFYASPFFVTLLSVILLKEQVSLHRWMLLLTGFIGVIIIVHPGIGIVDPAAILPVIAALAYAGGVMITRRMAITESASVMSVYFIICSFIVSGVLGLFMGSGIPTLTVHPSMEFLTRAWVIPTFSDLLKLITLGIIAAMGLYCLSQAYRLAKASTITPFEYCGMVPTALMGYLIWNEIPSITTLIGILFIIGSGIFLVKMERG